MICPIRRRRAVRFHSRVVVLAVLAHASWIAARARAAETTAPQLGRPTGYVTDAAHVLDASQRDVLEHYLGDVERTLHAEFAVVTVATTEPQSIEDYSADLYKRWGIGSKTTDDGLLLLVAVDDHRVKFEVGYGLEGSFPDVSASQVIRNDVTPRFHANDFAGGILAGMVDAARAVARDEGVAAPVPDSSFASPPPAPARDPSARMLARLFPLIFFFILFGLLRSGRRRRRGWFGPWIGPWFGGGGFGGFGGSGGFGGGASGGGFGGFGGGASGGGGATGSW